jgi:protein involved in sex pheromone biosynthesis
MRKTIKLTILAMLLAACSPKISSNIEQKRAALTIEDKVAI